MNATELSAYAALILAVVSATMSVYRGWRKRIQDAAQQPFLVGNAAIEEAQTALRLKNDRLAELTESEARLRVALAEAKGTAEAQQQQIVELQSRLYQVDATNRELQVRAEAAERREQEQVSRIATLERDIADLRVKLALQNPGY
jgi:uncharacterized protein HemX